MADPPHHNFSAGPPNHLSSMAYQYQIPASGLESPSMMPGYNNHPMESLRSTSPSYGHDLSSSNRILETSSLSKSKDSKTKRSMSTPNIRGTANTDAAALALANDKRRNKLGYHRTSVACGHCRRRKIRCIPAAGDPQNRCSNCIRLKKECNFYPVDQQPQPEPKRRGSKAQSGTGRASPSLSPSTSSGQLPDMQPGLPYQHLNMPPIQDIGGAQAKRQRTESFSPENKVVTSSRTFDYNHDQTNWMGPEVSLNTKSPAEMSGAYWRGNSQESPMTPAFSPYSTPNMHIPNPQNWSSQAQQGQTEPVSRETEWSTPQRSISYSNLEGMQSNNQYSTYGLPLPGAAEQYPSSRPRHQHQNMYPPPISTSTNTIPAPEIASTPTIGTPHAQSAGPMSTGSYSSWNNQYAYPKVSPVASNVDPYPAWNANHHGGHQNIPDQVQGGNTTGYGGYGDSGNAVYYAGLPHSGR